MKAAKYAQKDRVGQFVYTEAIGEWPGGACKVIEMRPDPDCEEIVMQVRRLDDGDECGVFWDEDVIPMSDPRRPEGATCQP